MPRNRVAEDRGANGDVNRLASVPTTHAELAVQGMHDVCHNMRDMQVNINLYLAKYLGKPELFITMTCNPGGEHVE